MSPLSPRQKQAALAGLKRRLATAAWERGESASERLTLGAPAIDLALGGGLSAHGLHEIMGPAATVFAGILAGKTGGAVAWITGRERVRRPYPWGLESGGLPAEKVLFIRPKRKDVLWSFEQVLKSGAIKIAITEAATAPDFTQSRRLQLAAQAGGALGLLLIPEPTRKGEVISSSGASAAETRWRASQCARSHANALFRYRLELLKNKQGLFGNWEIDWHGATHCFNLAAPLSDRPDYAKIPRMAG